MKVSDYRGYEINLESGQFQISRVSGWYERYKDVTDKIDRLVKAESHENFPIEAINTSMQVGTLTSVNREEKTAWFSHGDSRGKESILDYSGKVYFYKSNENNLKLAKRHAEITAEITRLSKERQCLPSQLTEPLNLLAHKEVK